MIFTVNLIISDKERYMATYEADSILDVLPILNKSKLAKRAKEIIIKDSDDHLKSEWVSF